MEYISLVDTSLDLNSNPRRLIEEFVPKQEIHSNFFQFGGKISVKDETSALVEELNRVNTENKKLTEMLTVLCENYNALRKQMIDYMSKHPAAEQQQIVASKKRKAESPPANIFHRNNVVNHGIVNGGVSESSSSEEDSRKVPAKEEVIKTKTSRIFSRTESSDTTSLVVKDGYQWRKYGQKVTRDNPSPRAYFKCSFAPTCPVKKKVQRSVDDQSVLVATYEGEHNHPHPSTAEGVSSSSRGMTLGSVPCSASHTSSGPTITLDLTKTNHRSDTNNLLSTEATKSPEFQKFLVEQMASSLSNDASFKAALAAAISGRYLQQNTMEKW